MRLILSASDSYSGLTTQSSTWSPRAIGKDGTQRTGLSVTAWEVLSLGQIGRRKPTIQSRDEQDAVPFDDPLKF